MALQRSMRVRAVMVVRKMSMRVSDRVVPVNVPMGFGHLLLVMLMMLVVYVLVVVLHQSVRMKMLVTLGEVQPHTRSHQASSDEQGKRHRFMEQRHSGNCTHEWRDREIGTRP